LTAARRRPLAAPADLMKRVTRDADYRGWMKAFLA
jgi:hypothetical protein